MKYFDRSVQYAEDVIDGKVLACIFVKQACQRYLDDLERSLSKEDFYFDIDKAEKPCKFLEKLPHVKGRWSKNKEYLVLSDWQIFIVCNIFGFIRPDDDNRRFREAYINVPRKNGKTFFVTGIALYMLTSDGEAGAEVYCGATSEKQAYEVFAPAKKICELEPELREHFGLDTYKQSIVIVGSMSKFEPVIGDPGDGASPSCGIADEFHEHKTSNLVETFETGMGAREQPLMIFITTAGSDMGSPCYEKQNDCVQVLKGTVKDDRIFCIIYTIDDDDEWDTIAAQKKANPNYGISVSASFLEGQLSKAKRSALKQSSYKTKHLDLWVGAKAAWMNMLKYQACRKRNLKIENFKGRRCYIGADLASKLDFACAAIVFPPDQPGEKYAVFLNHYLPEDRIEEVERYRAWHKDGWITATPGNVIDFQYIEDDLVEFKSDYEIIEFPYDPFQATQFAIKMNDLGFPMIEYGATVKNFSEPMKELEKLIVSKQIEFQLDPVLLWMFGNVVAQEDKKENIYPNKETANNKIDGVVALIMSLARAIHDKGQAFSDGEMLIL